MCEREQGEEVTTHEGQLGSRCMLILMKGTYCRRSSLGTACLRLVAALKTIPVAPQRKGMESVWGHILEARASVVLGSGS